MSKKPEQKSYSGLKSQCLPFTEVLAQSIANIAPSCGPALGIPLVFMTAGNGTWLAYLFATVAVALIGYHINHFARRSASPGALYTYVADGLGVGAGFMSGWGLILAYLLTGSAVLAGFASYGNVFLGYFGAHANPLLLAGGAALLAWYVCFKDIKLSAKIMLLLEAVSLSLIIIVGAVVLFKRGFYIDTAQFALKGVSFDSIRIGLVLAFFSFVGFESATTLGDEAQNPLKNIPRAVILSGIAVGLLFIVMSYTELVGFMGSKETLSEVAAPMSFLAEKHGIGFMGFFITIGAMVSFWACAVACINAGARLLLTMGQHRILPSSMAQVHENNETPHVAVTLLAIVISVIPLLLIYLKAGLMDIFGWLGTIATLGFLLSYALIVVAAPVFLYKRKELKVKDVVIAAISFGLVMLPIVGSVYPLPPFPFNMFPFIFLGWIILAGSWFAIVSVHKKEVVARMKSEIQLVNSQYAELSKAANE